MIGQSVFQRQDNYVQLTSDIILYLSDSVICIIRIIDLTDMRPCNITTYILPHCRIVL